MAKRTRNKEIRARLKDRLYINGIVGKLTISVYASGFVQYSLGKHSKPEGHDAVRINAEIRTLNGLAVESFRKGE